MVQEENGQKVLVFTWSFKVNHWIWISVGGWVERDLLDTADTLALNGGDLDVALVSPGSSPGVSDEVVLLTVLGSVANSGDGVVEGGSASGGVHNSAGVVLEDGSVGLNSDGGRSLGNGSLELID